MNELFQLSPADIARYRDLNALAQPMPDSSAQTLFVFVGPSGSGKSSLIKFLIRTFPMLTHSISTTTRKPRPGEIHGKEYYFLDSPGAFEKMIGDGMIAESDRFPRNSSTANYYGTSRAELTRLRAEGKVVLMDLTWPGVEQLRAAGYNVVPIFVRPPSLDELELNLRDRGDDPAKIGPRLDEARVELLHAADCPYVIVNCRGHLSAAQDEVADLLSKLLGMH